MLQILLKFHLQINCHVCPTVVFCINDCVQLQQLVECVSNSAAYICDFHTSAAAGNLSEI